MTNRRRAARPFVVGVISDTHGLMRPEALAALKGVDLIAHAGDVGSAAVLDRLRQVAPVIAVRGNNDREAWAAALPEILVTDVAGVRLCLIHDLNELRDQARDGIDVVISGHSHRPGIEQRGSVLLLNPGSAGPRRFSLPVAVAQLSLGPERKAQVIELEGTGAGATPARAGGRRSPRTSRAPRPAGTPPPTRGSGRSRRRCAGR